MQNPDAAHWQDVQTCHPASNDYGRCSWADTEPKHDVQADPASLASPGTETSNIPEENSALPVPYHPEQEVLSFTYMLSQSLGHWQEPQLQCTAEISPSQIGH
jgi:hypothetical protein